jgi:hypothetical protein
VIWENLIPALIDAFEMHLRKERPVRTGGRTGKISFTVLAILAWSPGDNGNSFGSAAEALVWSFGRVFGGKARRSGLVPNPEVQSLL